MNDQDDSIDEAAVKARETIDHWKAGYGDEQLGMAGAQTRAGACGRDQ